MDFQALNHYVLFQKAEELYKSGKHEEALSCFDNALEIDPNTSIAIRNKGILYLHLGNYEQAIYHLDKAIEINPNDSELLFSKGLALSLIGKHEYALMYYFKSLEIPSNDYDTLVSLASHLIKFIGYENAIIHSTKVLEIDLKNPLALAVKQLIANEKKIIKVYKKYINKEPNQSEMNFYQKLILQGKSLEWVENEIKNSGEAKSAKKEIEIECGIVDLYKKYLYRKPDMVGLDFYKQQILQGKSLEWVENEIKNSGEGKSISEGEQNNKFFG